MLLRLLVYIHVLAALTFFLTHGTSAAMTFKLRKETNLDRIRALLDLSASTMKLLMVSFLVMGITGLIMPFLIHIWDKGWIWASIILMLGASIYMGLNNEKSYKILRKKVGLPYMQGRKEYPPEPPAEQAEIVSFIQTLKVEGLVISGYIVPAIVLALMIFKPF